jgi:hypothetical protein
MKIVVLPLLYRREGEVSEPMRAHASEDEEEKR